MATVTVSTKGWVVIPAEYRRKHGITPGSKVSIIDYGGVLSILPVPDDPIRQAIGYLKGEDSLIEELLSEHAEELARESREW